MIIENYTTIFDNSLRTEQKRALFIKSKLRNRKYKQETPINSLFYFVLD